MKKKPNYVAELHKVEYSVPTGRLVCDCCWAAQGQPHTRFCHWNPTNTKSDIDARIGNRRPNK
jgi:hypothetical protein